MSRPDFMEQFDVDLEAEDFEDAHFELLSPIEPAVGVPLTKGDITWSIKVSDEDRAEMDAVYRGLAAHYFPDQPTVQ